MNRTASPVAMASAFAVFAVWTIATWFFEGRIETLLRPNATADRAIYAIVANLLIGTVLAVVTLRFLVRNGEVSCTASGFGRNSASAKRIAVAVVLGLAFYLMQGAPSLDPVVVLNAFTQVFVVSVAEVVVCWALIGAATEAFLSARGRAVALAGSAVAASVLFGLYHYAHSAPFNTLPMVALLSAVGLVTSAFFLASRDIYATAVFHNFLGVFGVVKALDASGQLGTFAAPQVPLLVMGMVTVAVIAASHWLLLRRSEVAVEAAS